MAALTFDDILGETPPPAAAPPKAAPTKPALRPRGAISIDELLADAPPDPNAAPTNVEAVLDLVKSTPSSIAKLITETIGTPLSVARMDSIEAPSEDMPWYRKTVPQLLGYEDYAKPVREALVGGQDAVRGAITENLPQPQYGLGKLAEEGMQWMGPAALATKGTRAATGGVKVANYLYDLMAHGAAPWGAYELADKYAGPEAGAVAALIAGGSGSALRTARSPEAVARRNTASLTPQDWANSKNMEAAGERAGVKLAGAESIAQAVNQPNHPVLKSLSLTESHPSGSEVTGRFFRPRAAQIDTAVENTLGAIAPRPVNPQNIGPDVSRGAKNVIDQTRQRGNDQTRPLYDAAATDIVPQADYDAIAADPRYAAALKSLRENNELGPEILNLPDNSVGVVDAVTQHLFERGEAASNAAERYLGSLRTGAAKTARDAASRVSPAYAQALAEQHNFRQGELKNVESGPVGDFSKATDTDTVANLLFPTAPTKSTIDALAGGIDSIRQSGQEMLPAARQALDRIWSGFSTGTLSGDRTRGGSKFANRLAGSPQRQELLNAVLSASGAPVGGIQALGDLIPVLQATGKRMGEGSPTAQRTAQIGDLSANAPLNIGETIATKSLSPLFGGILKDYVLHGNLKRLAELMTGSVEDLQIARERAWENFVPELASRTGLSTLFASEREK